MGQVVEVSDIFERHLRAAQAEERGECEEDVKAEARDCGCVERILARMRLRAEEVRNGG
jgi:hypothetical protein